MLITKYVCDVWIDPVLIVMDAARFARSAGRHRHPPTYAHRVVYDYE